MCEQANGYLLDTHVWIWLMEGNQRLAQHVRTEVQNAVANERLGVSAISVWEVAMLEARGRIVLDLECDIWVRRAIAAPGISLIPLEPEIAIASTRLPGDFHGDPADRMIVATARRRGCTLITADHAILAYAETGQVRVLPAV